MDTINKEKINYKQWSSVIWTDTDFDKLFSFLYSLQDLKYRDFQTKLIPSGCSELIGIRLLHLQQTAKWIVKGQSVEKYLQYAGTAHFEEAMLKGLVTGKWEQAAVTRWLTAVEAFLPDIKNWSVCDSFCSSLKRTNECREEMYLLINRSFESGSTYKVRFALVMLLFYYIEEPYLDDIFTFCKDADSGDYYIMMAAAWLLSICYVKYPAETGNIFDTGTLPPTTLKKALQKIRDSHQISKEDKLLLSKHLPPIINR